MDNSFDSLLNASAVPQDEKVQAFIAESKNNRNRCYELSEQVTAQVATDGKMLQKYLDVQSTFDRYTTNNALLILAQRPDAQKLGDYGYWRDHGFYLKRMERQNPVLILEPGKTYKREDGTVGNYYNAKKLYDISQTTMSDTTIQKSEYEEHDLIRALVSTPPVNIVAAEPEQMPDEKGAFFKPEEGCIYVRKGMSAQEIFKSLVPELVFAGYADGNPHYDKNEDAFHVSCASYMLCKKYGIDTSRYDFHMHQSSLKKWRLRKCGRNFPEPEMQRMQFLQEWQRYWIRIEMQLTDSQRLKDQNKTVLKMRKPRKKIQSQKKRNRNPEDSIGKKHARKIWERRMQNEQ